MAGELLPVVPPAPRLGHSLLHRLPLLPRRAAGSIQVHYYYYCTYNYNCIIVYYVEHSIMAISSVALFFDLAAPRFRQQARERGALPRPIG